MNWTQVEGTKELSFCHKLAFSNPYIFETWWCKPLLFQTWTIIWSNRINSLNYQRSRKTGWKELENQSLWQKLNSFMRHYTTTLFTRSSSSFKFKVWKSKFNRNLKNSKHFCSFNSSPIKGVMFEHIFQFYIPFTLVWRK